MLQKRTSAIWFAAAFALALDVRGDDTIGRATPDQDSLELQTSFADVVAPNQSSTFAQALSNSEKRNDHWIALKEDSAEFPKATKIPGTEVWWKFGGYVKGDFIHDFKPAGTPDRWVPTTIPTDGSEGQNTLMQAKASRLNLDVRAPSDWGTIRGFVETDFFTNGNQLRI